MAPRDDPSLTAAQMADLVALADGTLTGQARLDAERRIAASPTLLAALSEQEQAVAVVHEVSAADGAPARLHADVTRGPGRARVARRRTLAAVAFGAAGLAVLAIALVLALGGGSGAPTVGQAVALAERGAAAPPPRPDPDAPGTRLDVAVQDLYFPNWTRTLGWRATGRRADRLDGHDAVTVYYAAGGRTVAYTVLSLPALGDPSAPVVVVDGLRVWVLRARTRTVVTWREGGHTCLLSGRGVPAATLERLAAWAPRRV